MKKNYAGLCFLLFLYCQTSFAQPYKWIRQLGTTGNDIAGFVKITSQKGICVAGDMDGTMQLPFHSITHTGGYIALFDSAGNDQWIIPAGGLWGGYLNYSSHNPAIALDASDNVYACGYYSDSVLIGTTWLADTGDYNCFLAKIDPAGNVLWARKITDQSYLPGITIDRLGNIIVAGIVSGTSDFDGTIVTPYGNGTLGDVVIAKYDVAGILMWVKHAGGTGFYSDRAESVTTDYNCNIYIGGNFRSTALFDNISIAPVNFATYDGFVAKYDAAGNAQWVSRAGHECTSIVADSAGNCYLGGAATPGDFSGVTISAGGGAVMYVAKINPTGNYEWIRYNNSSGLAQNGASDFSITTGVVLDEKQNCYVTGLFWDSLKIGNLNMLSYLDPACGTGSRINSFIIRLDSAGNALWGKPLKSCEGASNGFSVDVRGCTVAACGMIRLPPAAVYFDADSLVSLGGFDGYVFTIDSCFAPTGINYISNSREPVSVYPNPFYDFTLFKMDNPVNYNKLKRLKVYDVYGKFVLEKIFSGPQYKLASENLNKGIYFYKIFMDDKLLQGGKLVVH